MVNRTSRPNRQDACTGLLTEVGYCRLGKLGEWKAIINRFSNAVGKEGTHLWREQTARGGSRKNSFQSVGKVASALQLTSVDASPSADHRGHRRIRRNGSK